MSLVIACYLKSILLRVNKVNKMIKSFKQNDKYYYCKADQNSWSQWACCHEDGLETWAKVSVSSYKVTRQNVIDAVDDVEYYHSNN